jgi:hypothetical protein
LVYYLTSFDQLSFQLVRECVVEKMVCFHPSGKEAVLVAVTPSVLLTGQPDLESLVLVKRFIGSLLLPIPSQPCHVSVCRVVSKLSPTTRYLIKADLEILAWGVLCATRAEANEIAMCSLE